ncbi:MAG: DUF465 domain-containing protein [Alphaproteobacteria bacterium]|jgi:hypothetical protein|nr:DUF465 domain-containing protein [Alphaproteobacteria bacterium]
MSIQGRIEELSTRHRRLDQQIESEQKRPAADPVRLQELKREKLRIKEELRTLKPS